MVIQTGSHSQTWPSPSRSFMYLVSGVILRDGSLESTGPRRKSAPEVPRCLLPLVRRGPLRWS